LQAYVAAGGDAHNGMKSDGSPGSTTIIMTQVIGYATLVLPCQSPPLVLAMQLGNVCARQAVQPTLAYALVGFLVLTPVNYFWWHWLGKFTSP